MAVEVILPRVDMDMATGQISRWYVDAGARVEKGQPLFEIETDKAAMEIEAPASGILRAPAETGVPIAVGAPVGWIAAEGEVLAASAEPAPVDSAPAAAALAPATRDIPPVRPQAVSPAHEAAAFGLRSTPLARRLAKARGIDLSRVKGTGPHGRIQARDVEAETPLAPTRSDPHPEPAAAGLAREPVAAIPPPSAASTGAATPAADGPLNVVWLRRGEGDPLVLIHGFGADLDGWRPFVQALAPGRAILAVDLPGHGLSRLSGRLDLPGLAETVAAAVAAAVAGSPVHLIGHSLGGAVASLVAVSGLVDARSLFLLAPAGLGPEIDGAFIDGFGRAQSEPALSAWMQRLVADPALITDALVRATVRARSRSGTAGHEAVAAAVFPEGTQATSITAAIARLGIPVRIVLGREDRVLTPSQATAIPGWAAVHRLEGVGHMPQLEARDTVVRLLEQHLRCA